MNTIASVKIERIEDRVHLTAPFNRTLPSEARSLGGRFDGVRKSWHLDARDEARVREMAIEIYGTDGVSGAGDLAIIHIYCSDFAEYRTNSVGGRFVLEKRTRDYLPRLGEGVILFSGDSSFDGNGSAQYSLIGNNNAVIEVRDLPRAAIPKWDGVTIIESTTDREALAAERENLLARIAEIDTLLAQ